MVIQYMMLKTKKDSPCAPLDGVLLWMHGPFSVVKALLL